MSNTIGIIKIFEVDFEISFQWICYLCYKILWHRL